MILVTADRLLALAKIDQYWFEDLVLDLEIIARTLEITPSRITVCGLDSLHPIHLQNSTPGIDIESAQQYQTVRIAASLIGGRYSASRIAPVYASADLLDPNVRSMLEEQVNYVLAQNITTLPGSP